MSSYVNFFDSAMHKLYKLRKMYPQSPRKAAFLMILWTLEKFTIGNIIGDSWEENSEYHDDKLHVAARLRGGIGDNILSLSFLNALAKYSRCHISFDIYTTIKEDIVHSLCYKQPYISNIYSIKIPLRGKYDLVADITRMAWFPHMDSRRLQQQSEELFFFVRKANEFHQSNLTAFSDEGQRIGMDFADVVGAHRQSQMDMSGLLSLDKNNFCLECEESIESVCKKFGITGSFVTLNRESGNADSSSFKLWPLENYKLLAEKFHKLYSGVSLILLGSEREGTFPDCLDLRGCTSFAELKTLLKGASLHIGGEGLMPHLRHFLNGGASIVLFGPTSSLHYGYSENINIQGKLCPDGCEWITSTWQHECLRGYGRCQSMESISVDTVIQHVTGYNIA